ncbi:hypothetical protein QBA75_38190 [Streptomyces stelliscabiei]
MSTPANSSRRHRPTPARQADLALGHSLGGLTLSLAVERLRARRAGYWTRLVVGPLAHRPEILPPSSTPPAGTVALNPALGRGRVIEDGPRWPPGNAARAFLGRPSVTGFVPERPAVPSLVQLRRPSFWSGPRNGSGSGPAGFEVRNRRRGRHTTTARLLDGFMKSLDGWI